MQNFIKNAINNWLQTNLPNHQIQINLNFNRNLTEPDGCTHLLQAFQCMVTPALNNREAKKLRENLGHTYYWEDNLDQQITIEIEDWGDETRITILNMLNF